MRAGKQLFSLSPTSSFSGLDSVSAEPNANAPLSKLLIKILPNLT